MLFWEVCVRGGVCWVRYTETYGSGVFVEKHFD
jgi:hypothetical protein